MAKYWQNSGVGGVDLIISSPISIRILVAMKCIAIKPTLPKVTIGRPITIQPVFQSVTDDYRRQESAYNYELSSITKIGSETIHASTDFCDIYHLRSQFFKT